jgi:hypothetical protein
MDELIKFHFAIFDDLLRSEKSDVITDKIEKQINEVKEKLKNTFNQESAHYTSACHYLDKEFENYIDRKKDKNQ